MIRTVATLFAKKTAIVAISGATIIGGATFALAVESEPLDVANEPVVTCDEEMALEAGAEETEDGTEGQGSASGGEPRICEPGDGGTGEEAGHDGDDTGDEGELDREGGNSSPAGDPGAETVIGAAADGSSSENAELTDPETDDTEYANHGEAVSTYAREHCRTEAAAQAYRNHGECVRRAAQSDLGKGGGEDADEEAGLKETETSEVGESDMSAHEKPEMSESEVPQIEGMTDRHEPVIQEQPPARNGRPENPGNAGGNGKGNGPKK